MLASLKLVCCTGCEGYGGIRHLSMLWTLRCTRYYMMMQLDARVCMEKQG